MRVLFIGVGDAFTCRDFGTSAVVEGSDGALLVDCPGLVLRALHEAAATANVGAAAAWPATPASIGDVIVTHLHGDHCNGLEALGFWCRIAGVARPRVHAIAPVIGRLWERLAPAMDAPFGADRACTLEDWFDVRVLTEDRVTTIAGLDVECRRTRHPVPTAALRLRRAGADRPCLAWSADTPDDPELRDWLGSARVIVHESNRGPAHTPIAALEAMPQAWRDRAWLVHLPDDFDPAATTMRCARAGQVLEV